MSGENPRRAGEAVSGGHTALTSKSRRLKRLLNSVSSGAALSAVPLWLGFSSKAHAQNGEMFGVTLDTFEVIQFAVFAGILGAALASAVYLIRERGRTADENTTLREKIAELNASLLRSDALLNLRDQRVVVWSADKPKPDLLGSLPAESGAPADRGTFLAFGRWLTVRSAAGLENAMVALREKGIEFDRILETQSGAPLEVQGRKAPSHAIVRFVSLSRTQQVQAHLKLENQRLLADYENLLGMADALKMPFWIKDAEGHLKWVNRAYAEAVEAENAEAAIRGGREFLGTQTREDLARRHLSAPVVEQIVSTVVGGDRKMVTVTDFASGAGSVGVAQDVSAIEALREEYQQMMRNHADTLDQLTTAVAKFDASQKLRSYNNAFQKLWDLDIAFLDSAPDHALLLDRLRGDGKIAEQPEWRRWKDNLLGVYRAVDAVEHWWHLPDGRTLRVLANPQPKGGVTWVFENLTEKIDLESRYNTAVRVQTETLDSLAEGVAVFGPDGRIRLSNPAFTHLWGIPADSAMIRTHISALREICADKAAQSPWDIFVAAVTGFDDERKDGDGRIGLKNGTVLSYTLVHLPNGQVMLTFFDITDSVNAERMLKDRNDALQRADQLKSDFVQRVSYELRSPLTNIIGFTELLDVGATGPLNERQKEYVGHISSSSSVLLTLVNDILDLATVDAGIMQLEFGEVLVTQLISSAAETVAERFAEHRLSLSVDVASAPPKMLGDENRIRQVLSNLLSNAANYAPEGSTVKLTCREVPDGTEFSVKDEGPGMSPELLDIAFRRFESHGNGGRRRGAGLGLSIVKSLVELHGGKVRIESGDGAGTTVVCFFPKEPKQLRDAAE